MAENPTNSPSPSAEPPYNPWPKRLAITGALLLFILCWMPLFWMALFSDFFEVSHLRRRGNHAQAEEDIRLICKGLQRYAQEYGTLPQGDNAQIMTALIGGNREQFFFLGRRPAEEDPKAPKRGIAKDGIFYDPWGSPYHIDTSNPAYPWVYSFGRDKKDDGGAPGSDDIVSWR